MSTITTDYETLSGTEFPSSSGGDLNDEDDRNSTPIPLGFAVNLYGKVVDTVVAGSNGFIYLNDADNMGLQPLAAATGIA
jgi:hypothetical protein